MQKQNISMNLDLEAYWGFETLAQALAFVDELKGSSPVSWGFEDENGDEEQFDGLDLENAKAVHLDSFPTTHKGKKARGFRLAIRWNVGKPETWTEGFDAMDLWVSPLPYEGKGRCEALEGFKFFHVGSDVEA